MPAALTQRRFPNPLTLLVGCILIAAALTWILPAGRYERREDLATGRSVVVPGTYRAVDPRPVGLFQAVVAIPKGIVDAASVIALIFLIGGGFTVVKRTGTFLRLVHGLVRRLRGRGLLVIPVASVPFALGGIMMQMQEELIAFVPVLLLLVRQLGFTPTTAVAMSLGPAAVGAAFSPVNPFQVVIAQKVAELPPASGFGFRVAFLLPALGIWIAGTMYQAQKTRTLPEAAGVEEPLPINWRDVGVLLAILAAPRPDRGHRRPRIVYPHRGPASHAVRGRDDARAGRDPRPGAEHQQPGRADNAAPGAAFGSDWAVTPGDGDGLSVRSGTV